MYPDLLFETCIQDRIGVSEVMGQRKNIFTDTSNRLRPVRSELEDFVSETILRMNRLPR
jgi:hypothetical protein